MSRIAVLCEARPDGATRAVDGLLSGLGPVLALDPALEVILVGEGGRSIGSWLPDHLEHRARRERPSPALRLSRTLVCWSDRLASFGERIRAAGAAALDGGASAVARLIASALDGGPLAVAALPLAGAIVAIGLLLVWPGYALARLLVALGRGLGFPLGVIERQARVIVSNAHAGRHVAVDARWDGCVVPWPGPDRPPSVPTLVVCGALDDGASTERPPLEATLFVCPDEATRRVLQDTHGVALSRIRVVPAGAAQGWADALQDLIEVGGWPDRVDDAMRQPWPSLPLAPIAPAGPPELFLFLQEFSIGGVLHAARDLVMDLDAINAARRQLRLTLGVLDREDRFTASLAACRGAIAVERFRLNPIMRHEVPPMLGGTPRWLAELPDRTFAFFGGAAGAALRADAWFALTDRFPFRLLPARPYGMIVYDMIQKRVPEVFDAAFFEHARRGMAPTARGAELVVATSAPTAADVTAEYGLDPARVRLVPVSHDPARRFGGLPPGRVAAAREPFVLNVTNASLHKGAAVLVRGFAELLRSRREPLQLVVCGYGTNHFARDHARATTDHVREVRGLVAELGLREPEDVVFLGYVDDDALLDLYQRCAVVVNSAKHDNGSFSLCEATYFGKPSITSRYAGADYLCERFGVPALKFAVDDAAGLAGALRAARDGERPAALADIAAIRARFAAPELSHRRYSERIYDALVALAESGRRRAHSAAP